MANNNRISPKKFIPAIITTPNYFQHNTKAYGNKNYLVKFILPMVGKKFSASFTTSRKNTA